MQTQQKKKKKLLPRLKGNLKGLRVTTTHPALPLSSFLSPPLGTELPCVLLFILCMSCFAFMVVSLLPLVVQAGFKHARYSVLNE